MPWAQSLCSLSLLLRRRWQPSQENRSHLNHLLPLPALRSDGEHRDKILLLRRAKGGDASGWRVKLSAQLNIMIQLTIGFLIVASGLNLLITYFLYQNYFSTKVFLLAVMVVNTLGIYVGLVYAGFPMNNWFAIFLSLLGGISASVQGGRIIVKSWRLAEQERSKTKYQESIITQSEL